MRERRERRAKTVTKNEKLRVFSEWPKLGLQKCHKVAYIAIQEV